MAYLADMARIKVDDDMAIVSVTRSITRALTELLIESHESIIDAYFPKFLAECIAKDKSRSIIIAKVLVKFLKPRVRRRRFFSINIFVESEANHWREMLVWIRQVQIQCQLNILIQIKRRFETILCSSTNLVPLVYCNVKDLRLRDDNFAFIMSSLFFENQFSPGLGLKRGTKNAIFHHTPVPDFSSA